LLGDLLDLGVDDDIPGVAAGSTAASANGGVLDLLGAPRTTGAAAGLICPNAARRSACLIAVASRSRQEVLCVVVHQDRQLSAKSCNAANVA